jgi:hypothetical protein
MGGCGCGTLKIMQRGRLPYLLIPLAALIPVLPLIFFGCSCGHDLDFHLLNWLEAARQVQQGTFHARWAFTAAYNAGEPRFVFYPPLSWTLGALLSLIFPLAWAPILYTWLILGCAGVALYRLALSFVTPAAAVLAAVFYLVNPYMLFTAYERTAYAELLAAVWIPLLLHAAFRPEEEGGVTIPRVAVPVALLWLTNAPAAVMSCYALALITVVRLALPATIRRDAAGSEGRGQTRAGLARNTAAGTALGLGLAAFYLVPAAYERRYVQIKMAILQGLRVQDNFLFHHTTDAFHDEVLRTASVVALILLAISAMALTMAVIRKTGLRLTIPLAVLTVTIGFLLTPMSNFVWVHAPEMAFLQFPWRLLAILAAVLGLAVGLALRSLQMRPVAMVGVTLMMAIGLTYPAYRTFRQGCDPEDTAAGRAALFHSNLGSEPTDEYTPVTADNDVLGHANPPYWLAADPTAAATPGGKPGPFPAHLAFDSARGQTLILNLRDYPAWRVRLNNVLVTTRIEREDGLIAVPVPAGHLTVDVSYAWMPDQIVGDGVTLLSVAFFGFACYRRP